MLLHEIKHSHSDIYYYRIQEFTFYCKKIYNFKITRLLYNNYIVDILDSDDRYLYIRLLPERT